MVGVLNSRLPYKQHMSEETKVVVGTVVAVVPEYKQVKVQARDGHLFAITTKARGDVPASSLHEGQKVRCTVTLRLPRVLQFQLIG